MQFDDALEAILALEALWRSKGGRVRLADLGVGEHRLLRSRGYCALPPERWRDYPGPRAMRTERVFEP